MGSPVTLTFNSFIKIDRRREDAVYLEIVYQFINAVRTRLLEKGDRLPGSRKLAEDLQVHRKTIVAALAELQEQGWVQSLPNIGTFVRNPDPTASGKREKRFPSPPEKAAYAFTKKFFLDSPFPEQKEMLYLTDGTPYHRLIPV